MRYRQLGPKGPTVSVVGLGCTNFGKRVGLEGTRAGVHAALDAGGTVFDTADIYRPRGAGASQDPLRQVLQGHRDQIVLATKFGADRAGAVAPDSVPGGSRRYIRAAIEGSLRRLRTDYV